MKVINFAKTARDRYFDDKLDHAHWIKIRDRAQKHADRLERAERTRREKARAKHAAQSLKGAL